jgi:hypothetical protein
MANIIGFSILILFVSILITTNSNNTQEALEKRSEEYKKYI